LLVWHFYHTALGRDEGGLAGILDRCAQALEQLEKDLRRFTQSQLRLSGLLLVADLDRSATRLGIVPEGPSSVGGSVYALCLPPDVDARQCFADDFRTGFQSVIEELLGKP
jgi:hypothetical protein